MINLADIDTKTLEIIKNFPTNFERTIDKNSYFRYVYSALLGASHFLEIGYRKGLFAEVCAGLGITSVHIDIDDKLLRAKNTENNKCLKIDSLSYLRNCNECFDLVFQDGSKDYVVRKEEYDLLVSRNLLSDESFILADDLHYDECMKAFNEAAKRYSMQKQIYKVKDKAEYEFGVLYRKV